MKSYLYIETYSEDSHIKTMDIDGEPTSSQPNIRLNNAEVYLAADKYDIQSMKALTITKLVDWVKNKVQSADFADMARNLLQLEHDPWPCDFVAECITHHLGVTFMDNDLITHLLREYGEIGVAVLGKVNESHMFAHMAAEDNHSRKKVSSRTPHQWAGSADCHAERATYCSST